MIALGVSAIALAIAVVAEIVFPGRDPYHAGWYNVGLAALVAVALTAARRQFAQTALPGLRGAVAAIACGAFLLGVAGIASGLLAPDNRVIVGAPGQRVNVEDLGGALLFPLAQSNDAASDRAVTLDRKNRAPVEIVTNRRDVGSFILRTLARTVVFVSARDSHGGHETITQPAGSVFLSPILLMQQQQTIDGLDLPFDSFAVPAAHRIVKAVLFSPQQAAALRGMQGLAVPAVLFAVDDENDRPLPHAIALVVDGQTVDAGGLQLEAHVLEYPSVEMVAAPNLAATALGAMLVFGGLVVKTRCRR